jgi:hypothetical protein
MVKIGIIAENKNDAKAISSLFKNNFPQQFDFHHVLPLVTGSQLDDENSNHLVLKLRREFEFEELNYILYIRDLDALITDLEKVRFRKKRFQRFARTVNNKAIFMLNIYEIEALILADIETYKEYKNNPDLSFDVSKAILTVEPDKMLPTYNKGELVKIIPLLNIENLKANHKYFEVFLSQFFKMTEQQKYRAAPYYT